MLASIKEVLVTKVLDLLARALPRNAKAHFVSHALRPEAVREAMSGGFSNREALVLAYVRGEGLDGFFADPVLSGGSLSPSSTSDSSRRLSHNWRRFTPPGRF